MVTKSKISNRTHNVKWPRSRQSFYDNLIMMIGHLAVMGVSFILPRAQAELYQPVEVRRDQPFSQKAFRYGFLECRHRTLTHYDQKGLVDSQQPYFETVGRVGYRLYRGQLDGYLESGMIKPAATQKFYQRRAVAGLVYTPFESEAGELQAYALTQLPFSQTTATGEAIAVDKQGSIVTIGVAPTIDSEMRLGMGPLGFRIGADVWTKVYSREQNIDKADQVDGQDLSLAARLDQEQIEDSKASWDTQLRLGVYLSPDYIRDFVGEFLIFYDNHHYPFYASSEDQSENSQPEPENLRSRYKAHRSSRWRLRMTWKVAPRVFLRNDFYRHYQGLFAEHVLKPDTRLTNLLSMGYNF